MNFLISNVFQVEALLTTDELGKDLSSVQNLMKKHQLVEVKNLPILKFCIVIHQMDYDKKESKRIHQNLSLNSEAPKKNL